MEIPTVKIEDGKSDYIVINEADFDAKKHKIFVEKSKDKSKENETEK